MSPGTAAVEVDADEDPILIQSAQHGYIQGMIDLALLGLSSTCHADLYFRSVNDDATLGEGDLDIGVLAPCHPVDANSDGIPDIIVPPGGCTADEDCPGSGICDGSTCILAVPCATAADCAEGEQCSTDGRCVPEPSGMCSTSAECGDLVCASNQCGPCTLGGDECGEGHRCAPTGHCVEGTEPGSSSGSGGEFGAGDEVRGGACACAALPAPAAGGSVGLLAMAGLALGLRRRLRGRG